ncbi:SRSF protein kinase [Trifolium repens]|nr:SRSF protein kinase [Trifolium repens]
MQGNAKRVAQGCIEKESPEEAAEDFKEPEHEYRKNHVKSSVESSENKPKSSFSEGESTQTFEKDVAQGNHGHRKGSRSMRKKLLADVDLKCKLVDFGNACWTYKQFTDMRSSACHMLIFRQGNIDVPRFLDLNTLLQQICGPLLAFALSLPHEMFF